jgi:undecaprenyl-diphosphatase
MSAMPPPRSPLQRIGRALLAAMTLASTCALAGGGPLGIDHRLPFDDSGIWNRSVQLFVQNVMIVGDIGLAAWEGGDTRLGHTAWQSIDSMALSAAVANVAKPVFGRKRPSETDDPDQWFQGGKSFPSGEVATITGIITPYVLEYRHDTPAVYTLELLPLYDSIARMKTQGHWQTDVLASFALGTATGYFAHSRESPFILSVLPHSVSIGIKKTW